MKTKTLYYRSCLGRYVTRENCYLLLRIDTSPTGDVRCTVTSPSLETVADPEAYARDPAYNWERVRLRWYHDKLGKWRAELRKRVKTEIPKEKDESISQSD